MSNNSNFFIGWKGTLSSSDKKWIRRILIPAFVGIPILLWCIVFFAKPFGTGVFELGNVKTFTGVYYDDPFPVFLLDKEQLPTNTSNSALLVGFGKHGAKTFMNPIENSKGKLTGHRLKLQGTLIYGDGKTLIELTKKEQSVLEVVSPEIGIAQKSRISKQSLRGEIIDPKCWFGVMKPAEGKVHKSCAIRCISGGIPPVFKIQKGTGFEYFIIKGSNGEDINQHVLDFIGEEIQLSGEIYERYGWKIINVDPSSFEYID
ncbi:MAG: hypothetical protein P1U56_21740 [Saprospiraceae bacterium]|nr:hypothetical protein [Saprospiraceae bacterium]